MRLLRALLLLALVLPTSWAVPTVPQRAGSDEGTRGPGVTLELETFDDANATLATLGWTTSTLAGPRPPYMLAAGNATTARAGGGYPARLDARLISPPFDLRHVLGAPLPPVANVTNGSALAGVDTRSTIDDINDTIAWPPPALDDRADLSVFAPPSLDGLEAPAAELTEPDAPDGAGYARLILEHAWSFSPGDGVRLEIRSRGADGAWSAWAPLAPTSGATSFARAPHVLPAGTLATYNGVLADGSGAFVGASAGVARTEVPLERYAGAVVQIAFHVLADSPLPPDTFGYALGRVEIRAQLADADVAIEGFAPLAQGALVATGAPLAPLVHIRNWGAAPAFNVTVTASLSLEGARASAPTVARVDLAPGERRTIALPPVTPASAANATLTASLAYDPGRPDTQRGNDRATISFRAANESRVSLALVVPRDATVTGVREEKRVVVEATNTGTAPAMGRLVLRATNASDATTEVATADLVLPAAGAVLPSPPEIDATLVELAWRPTERGTYRIDAGFAGARSSSTRVHVDLAPAPILETSFAPGGSTTAAFGEHDADGLSGWSFSSWGLANGTVVPDAPAAPSPRRVLVARPADDLGQAELDAAGDAERAAARRSNLTLTLPVRADVTEPTNASQDATTDVSYARLLLLTDETGCECLDARGRLPLLAPLLNSSLHQESLTVGKNVTRVVVNGSTISIGAHEGELLLVAVNMSAAPGLDVAYAPLLLARENETAVLLPASAPMPYDEDGEVRCCLVGPFSARSLRAALPEPRAGGAASTHLAQHTIARSLGDLLAGLPPGELSLVLEHRASLGAGGSALVEVEPEDAAPPELRAPRPGAILVSNDTAGWEPLWIPLSRAADAPTRLRLTLRSDDPGASWHVDSLRVVHRADASSPWRVVAHDDLEREHVDPRWSGATGEGLPSAYARGWSLEAVPRVAPHRFVLTDGGVSREGEENATRALRWDAARGDGGPVWSVARLPPIVLHDLAAPTLTLSTRFDLGAPENGTFAAGTAFAARVERPDGSFARVLLDPVAPGLAYGGHVSAPAFAPLAATMGIEVPRGAPASALVGQEEDWNKLTLDLSNLRDARRVWIEIHVIATRAAPLWLEIDDLRVGEPGPAHDVAIVGLPTLPQGAAIGLGVPTPIAITIADLGRFAPRETTIDVSIVDPSGNISYGPAKLRLTALAGPTSEIVLPQLWAPATYGRHVLHARATSAPPDERPDNDRALREIDVRDELGGALLSAALAGPARAAPGVGLALDARVRNNGTLPLGGGNAALVALQVYDGATPLLATPVKADVAALLGRALRPGETADLRLSNAWTPPRSGVFRVQVALEVPALGGSVSAIERTLRVEETADAPELASFAPDGPGWTNASAGGEPAAWTFVAGSAATANLTSPAPIELRGAASATLSLTHRHALEEGFDAGLVEARLPGSPWFALTPAPGYEGRALAPSPLVDASGLERPAFTGASGTRTTTFDLGAHAELREPVVLLDTRRGAVAASEEWLGPAGEGWHAPSRNVPAGAPPTAIAYERADALRYALDVPPDASGALVARLDDWRGLGEHGVDDVPRSRARVTLRAPDGTAHEGTPSLDPVRAADWTTRSFRFPTAPPLAGRSVVLVVEAVEVAARVNGTFTSDAIAPHDGYAVRDMRVLVEGRAGELEMPAEPERASRARWILDDGTGEPSPAQEGFVPLEAGSIWSQEGTTWTARRGDERVPDARLVFPLDLRLAVHRASLVVDGQATRGASVEVSSDGGRTWTAGLPLVNGNGTVPLDRYAGSEVLVALRARLGTSADADDDLWEVFGLRVEADVFRGDALDVRLRAASDEDGPRGSWEIIALATSVVRHGPGLGVRILEPDEDPITAGFRTLVVEVLNRGPTTSPPTTLALLATDPPERGGRGHGANRTVPSLAPGTSAIMPVRGADLNWFLAANASPSIVEARVEPPWSDGFLADNVATRAVGGANVRERSLAKPLALNVTPQALVIEPAKAPSVAFTAWVTNDGEDVATLGPSVLRIWKDDVNVRNLTNAIPSGGRLDAGASRDVTWSWKPDASLARGSYRAEAEIGTTTSRGLVLHSVNATFVMADAFLGEASRIERFGDGAEAWTCASAPPCAREDTTAWRSAPASLAIGIPASGVGASSERSVVTSPEFPLNATLGGVLRVHARHALAPGESARVLLARVATNGSILAFEEVGRFTARSAGYDEGRFPEASFPIAGAEGFRGALVRFDAPTPPNASAPPFVVDDVSLAPLDASWRAPARVNVTDGVAKRVRIELRNDGSLTDTFVVRLRDADGRPISLPAGWSVDVLDAATGRRLASSRGAEVSGVVVPARGTRTLELSIVSAPTGAGAPLRGPVPIALTANATLLPDLSRTLTLDLRSQAQARSDVGIVGVEVRGASDPPGRARSVEVAIVNRGLAAALAALRVSVQQPDGVEELPDVLADVAGSTSPSVALAPGARKTITFVWTPRHPGAHRVVASLDPDGMLREAERADHVVERDVDVSALPFPDLRVALFVEAGSSFLGRATPVVVNVTNAGATPARQVEVSLRAGVVDLLSEGSPAPIGDLEPGRTQTLRAIWTPEVPGNATLLATAFARAGLSEPVESLDDNAASRVSFVREPSARLEPTGDPGGFRLTNGGNANETYLLRAVVPAGWSYSLHVGVERVTRVELAPNASERILLAPLAPPGALAGERDIVLEAVSASTGEVRRALSRHVVAPRHALTVTFLPTTIDPREPALEALIENGGNTNEDVTFRADALPAGWRLVGTTASVPAGGRVAARLLLDLGPADEPRAVPVRVSWTTGAQQGTLVGSVRVEALHGVELVLDGEAGAGRARDATLTLRNLGNVVERGIVRIALPDGFVSDLDGRSIVLAKGETRRLAGWIAGPEGATGAVRIDTVFDAEARHEARTRLPIARHDLRIAWGASGDRLPGASARESVVLENVGNAEARDVAVTLYVDGRPVSTRSLEAVAPGETADLALVWTPVPGVRTVALVAQTLDGSADATPHDNARVATWSIAEPASPLAAAAARAEAPAPALLLVLAAAALAILGRRRA